MEILQTVDDLFYRKLGFELSKIRHEKKISLSDLSNLTNLSKQKIDRWELGISRISKEHFSRLCSALNTPEMLEVEIKIGL